MIDSFDFVFLLLSMFSLITEDTRTVVLILLDMVLVSPDEKTGELFLPRSDHRKILPKVDQVYILADRLGIAVEKDKTFTRSEMQSLLHKILIPIWSQIDDEEHLEMLLTRFNAERFFKGSLELTKFFLQKSRGLLMRDERFKRWIPPPNEDHDLTSSWSNATVTQATFNASTRDHAQAHDYPTLRVQPDDSPTIASNIYYDTTNKSEARNPAILEDDCFTPNNKLNDAPTESQLTEGRAVSPHSDTRPSIDTAEPSANAGPDDRTQLTPDLSPRFVTEARSGNPDYLASVAPEAKNMMENIKSDTSSTKFGLAI
ncbi:hypothetical protein FRC07_000633 [Ceratobasidium sp. 392]|nr:hypothetical protein FRC07_000633 [Ceratobasidium sp. 392]